MAIINPHATAVNDFPPNVGSIANAISGAIIIPRIEREMSEILSTKGEKILLPTSVLPGSEPVSSMTFRL